jgi:hypothetical protein
VQITAGWIIAGIFVIWVYFVFVPRDFWGYLDENLRIRRVEQEVSRAGNRIRDRGFELPKVDDAPPSTPVPESAFPKGIESDVRSAWFTYIVTVRELRILREEVRKSPQRKSPRRERRLLGNARRVLVLRSFFFASRAAQAREAITWIELRSAELAA